MAFDLALYPPTMRNRSGRLSLLQWGVAVSSDPRETSSPRESSHYPEAVSFLCPCQDSRPAASAAHLLSERGLSSAGLRGTQTYRRPSAFSWQCDSMSRNYKRLSEEPCGEARMLSRREAGQNSSDSSLLFNTRQQMGSHDMSITPPTTRTRFPAPTPYNSRLSQFSFTMAHAKRIKPTMAPGE